MVGSGGGILSMAALRLGAVSVVGIDIDPVATFVACEIVRLNDLRVAFIAGSLSCLGSGSFRLAMVNILPHHWIAQADRLVSLLAPGGRAVISGLLAVEAAPFGARVEAAGLEIVDRRQDGEWTALLTRRSTA